MRSLLTPRSRVLISVDNIYLHWLLILALGRLGHVTSSVDPAKFELMQGVLQPTVVVSDRAVGGPLGESAIRVSSEWLKETLSSASAEAIEPPGLDTPARLFTSSGTTGRPKKLMLTHRQIMARWRGGTPMWPLPMFERLLCQIGVDTWGGYSMVTRTWAIGGAVCLFNATPAALLARGVTGLLTSPRQLQLLLERTPPDFSPIPDLTIVCGGSRVSPTLAMAARMRLGARGIIAYGSTEAGMIACMPFPLIETDASLTGIVAPGVEIEAIDAEGLPVPPGVEGEIRVRTLDMAPGYFEDPEATARHFRDGWFHPGDVGSISAAGEVRILGRVDDLVNAGGVKIAPEVIEEVLLSLPSVRDAGVFSLEDPTGKVGLWAAIVDNGAFDAQVASQMVKQKLASGSAPIRFMSVSNVPRNSMGKVERLRLRAQAAALAAPVRAAAV